MLDPPSHISFLVFEIYDSLYIVNKGENHFGLVPATCYMNDFTLNISCLFITEKMNNVGYLFNRSRSLHWNIANKCLFFILVQMTIHLRINESRTNTVDNDSTWGNFFS